jgi:hypothetical protein
VNWRRRRRERKGEEGKNNSPLGTVGVARSDGVVDGSNDFSAGDSPGDLHHQCDRVVEHVASESHEIARLVSQQGGGLQAALSGAAQYRQEMDDASP